MMRVADYTMDYAFQQQFPTIIQKYMETGVKNDAALRQQARETAQPSKHERPSAH